MNIETGQLVDASKLEQMLPAERAKYVEVKRDLSKLEAANLQIRLYSPCGCGSGKKFKFCCYRKPSASAPNRGISTNSEAKDKLGGC